MDILNSPAHTSKPDLVQRFLKNGQPMAASGVTPSGRRRHRFSLSGPVHLRSRVSRLIGNSQRGRLRHLHRHSGLPAGPHADRTARKFFAPLALSYILAILASLLVALTVTPALAYVMFGKGVRKTDDPPLQRWLKAGYRRVLGFVSR